ncbi:MAG TPA: histidine phosphatase family protein [Steroidobacteraceae bacterium]
MIELIHLIRHGETEWSRSGRHTGRTDVPLTPHGEQQARHVGELLRATQFSRVLVSPLQRARRTCELAGLGAGEVVEPDLREWDYGEYEGLTRVQIRARCADWDVFRDGCPGGETPTQVCVRADAVVAELRAMSGPVAVFSHGHFLRALAVRWIGQPLVCARHLGLDAGGLSTLGYEHHSLEEPAIELWNAGVVPG